MPLGHQNRERLADAPQADEGDTAYDGLGGRGIHGSIMPGFAQRRLDASADRDRLYARDVSRKSGRSGHRQGPRQRRPNATVTPLRVHDADPELVRTMRAALRTGEPVDFLGLVSGLLQVAGTQMLSGDSVKELPDLDTLVDSFIEVPYAETTAALTVIRALSPDPGLGRRIDEALSQRRHPMPAWLEDLPGKRREPEVWTMTDVLRDGDDYFLGIELDGGNGLTCIVYVDHNLGTVVKDAFVVPVSIATVLAKARETIDDAEQTLLPFDPATARAVIERAERDGDLLEPPLESDTWPVCRPLVDWFVRLLPAGGTVPARREWSDDELEDVVDDFVNSPYGDGFDTPAHLDLLDATVGFAAHEGPGDPLRWSAVSVELLLVHWFPSNVLLSLDDLLELPDTLRQFVRYCHVQQGIPSSQTAETLASVDRWEPVYLAQLDAYEAAGVYEGLDDGDPVSVVLASLDRAVGGREALLALDVEPLPDEPFDWDGIDDDLRDLVAAMLAHCDRVADELLDVEHRTAMRRLLHRVATEGPGPLRRKAAANRSAAAIAWLIHCTNGIDKAGARVSNRTLLTAFGVGSVNERASSFVRALGLPPVYSAHDVELDSCDYLVSATRVSLIRLRDVCLSA